MSQNASNHDAIRTSQLTKLYNIPRSKQKRVAVDQLDLSVCAGEIFGFLGPNGAGKTTTIKMLLSFVRPSSGDAWIFGRPVESDKARSTVGYVPEQPYFPKFLTCREVVKEHGALCGLSQREALWRSEICLELVGMEQARHTPLSKLSKGMTQRVGLACALVGDPQLLILDEPSSGLDPVGRKELREMLSRFKDDGKTIFVSSHLLAEMEPVCDRVGVLAGGKLVACGAPDEIVQACDEVSVAFDGIERDDSLEQQLSSLGGSLKALPESERSQAGSFKEAVVPARQVYSFIEMLHKRKAVLRSVEPQRETLEDAFLRLVKGAAQ